MRKLILSLGLAATVLAGGIAQAQSGPSRGGGDFTRAQAQQMAEQAFERMDANSDGVLDQQDRAARQKARFDRLDTDSNGAISYDEFAAVRERRQAMRGERGPEQRAERGERGDHRGHRGMGMQRLAGADGKATKADFVTAALQRFDSADADRNGTVTAQERQAARQSMRDQMRQPRQAS